MFLSMHYQYVCIGRPVGWPTPLINNQLNIFSCDMNYRDSIFKKEHMICLFLEDFSYQLVITKNKAASSFSVETYDRLSIF